MRVGADPHRPLRQTAAEAPGPGAPVALEGQTPAGAKAEVAAVRGRFSRPRLSRTLTTDRAELRGMTPYDALTEFLWRAGVFALVLMWVLVSFRRTLDTAVVIHQNWERWETNPVPDWEATKNLGVLLFVVGANLLLLWFALWWFGGGA